MGCSLHLVFLDIFSFYTLLTVYGALSKTDDLLCAQLDSIYSCYLSEAPLYTPYCILDIPRI